VRPFAAAIRKIGVNPYVLVARDVLNDLFRQADRRRGPIPVTGTLNRKPFTQTLVKFRGHWRLYINGPMLRTARVSVGDIVTIQLKLDRVLRVEPVPTALARALRKSAAAQHAFGNLAPSRRKEICRYLNALKTEVAFARNCRTIVRHLQRPEQTPTHALFRRRPK
jgi:Bacteriocin-protection, YdeI or OmpD-Associated/Domain of unknown function (DUF1905)